ncbi:helix-turn-helix transcriptional regulator [Streptomyces sp. RB6PN25]|uniref:Helix-turn-helix transcriptional regulator n=1 Tax=Streptomyces humicola TaxID=2953240 RepID=A0ABT1PTT1_9ACTN|nr:helix-turn-helix transcriptional regulator [Streptomyces humicola]MCQ4081090.1 helix-turn-helix transcriptional regulator [Streptomyces humicola]
MLRTHSADEGECIGEVDSVELYRLMVRQRHLDLSAAADMLGWSEGRTAAAAEWLSKYELLVPLLGEGNTFGVSAPRSAASRLLVPLDQQIERLEREAEHLRADLGRYQVTYHEAIHETEDGNEFSTIAGLDAINAELEVAAARCTEEVLTVQPGGGRNAESLAASWEPTRAMLERGVQMCTIYQHSARFHTATRQYVKQVTSHGGDVRTVGECTDRLIIFDRKIAFIPARGDRQIALVIHQPAVVKFLVSVFERFWNDATPFSAHNRVSEVKTLLSDVRMSIIKLLAEGETDNAIARRMGVSVRTCRGHIAKIYEEFGARSRCQLGVLIATSGILDADDVHEEGNAAAG